MEIDRTKLVNEIEQTAKAIPFAEILKGAFGRATTMVKEAFGELGKTPRIPSSCIWLYRQQSGRMFV
jgi:hypothetical protein